MAKKELTLLYLFCYQSSSCTRCG